ncbi:hypothetical protein L2E82_35486 [Cichorium intybus]|uniref:Uncharacterized protein n=1 Tax=Cichorium intybus TaxID=13427 RepID=A0ACB9BP99_CICIN|nr:hypothetical protein L2E82_35486 [Cichorium intybus]
MVPIDSCNPIHHPLVIFTCEGIAQHRHRKRALTTGLILSCSLRQLYFTDLLPHRHLHRRNQTIEGNSPSHKIIHGIQDGFPQITSRFHPISFQSAIASDFTPSPNEFQIRFTLLTLFRFTSP